MYDGFVGEISGTGRFVYNGVGEFILDKRISVSTTNSSFTTESSEFFRDLTIPIQNATLTNFSQSGIPLYGVPGSGFNYPTPLVFQYDESTSTDVSTLDFIDATALSNPIHNLHSGWKLLIGRPNATIAYTFKDTGAIFQGDVTVNNLTFTSDAGSDNTYRAANDGWALIGNPYACSIDMNAVVDDVSNTDFIGTQNTSGIFGKIWVQAPYDIDNGDFLGSTEDNSIFYNAVTNVGDPTAALIPSHQSFWVKTYAPNPVTTGSFSFTISEDHKVDNQQIIRKAQSSGPTVYNIPLLTGGKQTGIITFHEFENASAGYDPVFDIERRGAADKKGFIDFSDNKLLGLRVNAIPANAAASGFKFSVSGTSTQLQLDLTDVITYANSFECAYLLNTQSGEKFDLKTAESTSYSFAKQANETIEFSVSFTNTLQVQTYAPACFGEATGGIKLDLTQYGSDNHFDIVKDNKVWYTVMGSQNQVKTTLPAGEYTILDFSKNLSCNATNTITFTIEEAPELIANFNNESDIIAGVSTTFQNISINAEMVEWFFTDDQTLSTDFNPEHTFQTPGKHVVSLTAYRNGESCSHVFNKLINVSKLTGVDDLNPQPISVKTIGSSIEIQTLENATYQLTNTQGQSVAAGSLSIGLNTITPEVATGVYTLRIESNSSEGLVQQVFIK